MTAATSPASTFQMAITVATTQQRAFDVFTRDFGTWWPKSHHIAKVDMATAVIEPKAGGRWFERGVDGSECEWGTVLAYDAPRMVRLSWHLQGDWSYDPNPDHASEVEVRFVAEAPDRTRVELEHRHLHRHGPGWEKLRQGIAQENGWGGLLKMYAAMVAK